MFQDYVSKKLMISNKKKKKLDKLPKSLYLVLLKEENQVIYLLRWVLHLKKYIMRRSLKKYGYEGYTLEKILRRIDTPR